MLRAPAPSLIPSALLTDQADGGGPHWYEAGMEGRDAAQGQKKSGYPAVEVAVVERCGRTVRSGSRRSRQKKRSLDSPRSDHSSGTAAAAGTAVGASENERLYRQCRTTRPKLLMDAVRVSR